MKATWEFVEVFAKDSRKHPGDREDIDITGEEFKEWTTARWVIAPEKRQKVFNHPAAMPEELVRRLLKLFTFRGDIVVDPFNGVGTTTFVAASMDREYYGIDISEEYCVVAHERIKKLNKSTSK